MSLNQKKIKAVLSETDFKILISGQIVKKELGGGDILEICLADIGYQAMSRAIFDEVKKGVPQL